MRLMPPGRHVGENEPCSARNVGLARAIDSGVSSYFLPSIKDDGSVGAFFYPVK